MTTPAPRHPFARGVWSGSVPLLLWAGHFTACYVAAAAGCIGVADPAPAAARITAFVAAATAVALLLGGWLLARACRDVRTAPGDLMPRLRLLVAALSCVGIAWTGVPLAFLAPCG